MIAALLIWASSVAAAAESATPPRPQPAELLRAVREIELDVGRMVRLSDVELAVGEGRIRIAEGVVIPTRPVAGRTVEWVFVGEARFLLAVDDPIEQNQLELFSGNRRLDVPVERFVMVQPGDSAVSRLVATRAAESPDEETLALARKVHREWLNGAERQAVGIRGGVFSALIGDAAFDRYFALWCMSTEIGSFVYEYDPEDPEPYTLAHFNPIDIAGWDRRRLERHLRHQQRRGRWLGTRIQDLGSWDIWLSGPWDRDADASLPSGFESEHYRLDVSIARDESTISGTARLRIRSGADGRRVVPLELFRDLVVEQVRDERGRPLFFFRSGGDVLVVLEEPSLRGRPFELEIAYSGRAIHWVERKTFDLDHTFNWYPHCGDLDRATYDVKIRWPRKLDLLASGRVVESGRDGFFRWQRRRLDEPAIAFSFAIGKFHIERERMGHVNVEVGFSRSVPRRLTEGARREILDDIHEALAYFEKTFGPYPLDDLTVVMMPRRYSQSFLGFVTLTDSILPPNLPPEGADLSWYRATTIAHEIAHQWWGNLIGWSSYRDQWLSEAMANYSALQFRADTREGGAAFLAQLSSGWRDTLTRTTPIGRAVESLGPIVLGMRLNSSLADNGYRAIVYRKGAVVLAMLARAVGPETFKEMMRSLVDAASNRVVGTATFLRAVEHMSGLDLDGFASRYIYGTGIPDVYYRYDVATEHEPGWSVEVEARVVGQPEYRQYLEQRPDGTWDVRREVAGARTGDDTAVVVPYRMTLDEGTSLRGHVTIEGARDRFSILASSRPRGFALDPHGEVLARFFSAQGEPKRVAALEARRRLIAGDAAGAERAFREALAITDDAPDAEDLPLPWLLDGTVRRGQTDARIHMELARLLLDRDDEEGARAELAAAAELVDGETSRLGIERDALEGRMELRRGDFEAAFKRAKRALRLYSPRRQKRAWRNRGWQASVGYDWWATTDVLAILAVSAHETGRRSELLWALEGTRDRGVDLGALESLVTEGEVPPAAR